MLRKEKLETCLNGKSPCNFKLICKDNSVSNQIQSTFLYLPLNLFFFYPYSSLPFGEVRGKKKRRTIYSFLQNQGNVLILRNAEEEPHEKTENFNVVSKTERRSPIRQPVAKQQATSWPGIYMIRCIINDKRYYGETNNISGRLASHKHQLNEKVHMHKRMQHDWDTFGEKSFEFVVLFMGSEWTSRQKRIDKETLLIIQDRPLCYNYLLGVAKPKEENPFWQKKNSEETKQLIDDAMRNRQNDLLGKPLKLNGIIYPSIAEASRATGMARKIIRKRLNDPNDNTCTEIATSDPCSALFPDPCSALQSRAREGRALCGARVKCKK